MVSGYVLGLHGGCSNDLLTPGHPGYRGATHEYDGAGDGTTSHWTGGPIAVGVGVHIETVSIIDQTIVRSTTQVV
jgi:hypothetical protein